MYDLELDVLPPAPVPTVRMREFRKDLGGGIVETGGKELEGKKHSPQRNIHFLKIKLFKISIYIKAYKGTIDMYNPFPKR